MEIIKRPPAIIERKSFFCIEHLYKVIDQVSPDTVDMDASNSKVIPLQLIEEAQQCLKKSSLIIRTPLIPLSTALNGKKVYLKCENLQPLCSFKCRGACFAMQKLTDAQRAAGVSTATTGNFGLALSALAKEFDCPCTILAPDSIVTTKLDKLRSIGSAEIKIASFSELWKGLTNRKFDGSGDSTFISSVDYNALAGYGTIGLEILEDLPDVDTIICPFGTGSNTAGIASAVKQIKPDVKIIACEPEVATPLKYSFEQGKASMLKDHTLSFADGIGGIRVLEDIWPYVNHLVDGTETVTLQQIVDSMRLIIDRASLVVEGAAAATVAAALSGDVPGENIVCLLSGGNVDFTQLDAVCKNHIPKLSK